MPSAPGSAAIGVSTSPGLSVRLLTICMGPRPEMMAKVRLRTPPASTRPKNRLEGSARRAWIAVPFSCSSRLGVSGSLLSTVMVFCWNPLRLRRSRRARMEASPPGGTTFWEGLTAVHPHEARTLRISSESVPELRIG